MATEIGAIKAKIELDMSGYQRGIENAKKKTEELGEGADKAKRNFDGLNTALTAIGSNIALSKLTGVIKEVVAESDRLSNSIRGLIEVSRNLGLNVDEVTESAQKLAAEGFMSVAEASQFLKTSLATGLGLEESINLAYAMADAAAYNRQAQYSWGQAIVTSMEGIKNQNSTLTDSVGVTKNLSVMYDEYAKSIGKTAGTLTDAEKTQAAYNGFLKEAQLFAGNAKTALDGYTGTVARFDQSMEKAKATLGDGLKPIVNELMKSLTPLIVDFTKWAEENKELVAGIAAGTTSLLAMVTAITTVTAVARVLSVTLKGLNASLGPIGLITTAIAILVPTIAGATGAMNLFKDSAEESGVKVAALAREYDEIKSSIGDFEEGSNKAKEANEKLKVVMEQIREISPDLVRGYDNETESIKSMTSAIEDNTTARIENLRAKIAEEKTRLGEEKKPLVDWGWFKIGGETDHRRQEARHAIARWEEELAMLEAAQKTFNNYRKEDHWGSMHDYYAKKYPDKVGKQVGGVTPDGKTSTGTGKVRTQEEIATELYRQEMKYLDYMRNMDLLTEEQEVKTLESMLKRYGQYSDLRMDLDVKIHRLKKLMAAESAAEVQKFYREEEQTYKSMVSEKERSLQEFTRKQISSIEESRREELKAIDERRRASSTYYDDRIRDIDRLISKERELYSDEDYETQLAKLQTRADLLSTAVGPEGIRERKEILEQIERMKREHSRDLRIRELEGAKQSLQDEKRIRDESFDREKADVQAKYDTLKSAFNDFKDDISVIENVIRDLRISSNNEANRQILSDLDRFVSEYKSKMTEIRNAQMQANSAAWHNASDDDRLRLSEENLRLGQMQGWTRKVDGHWYDQNGFRVYHTGKDAHSLGTFSYANKLLPDEIMAILRRDEYVFTPHQLSSLLTSVRGKEDNKPNIINHIDMSVSDVVLEDKADIQTLYSERERVADKLLTKGWSE